MIERYLFFRLISNEEDEEDIQSPVTGVIVDMDGTFNVKMFL